MMRQQFRRALRALAAAALIVSLVLVPTAAFAGSSAPAPAAATPIIVVSTGPDGTVHTTWLGKDRFPFSYECGPTGEDDVNVTTFSERQTSHKDIYVGGHDYARGSFADGFVNGGFGFYRSVAVSNGRVRAGSFADVYFWAAVDPVYAADGSVATAASFRTTAADFASAAPRHIILWDRGQLFQDSRFAFNSAPYDAATAAPIGDDTKCGPAASA